MTAMSARFHMSLRDALKHLPSPDNQRYATVFEHGTLDIEIYAPRGVDRQTPHTRDEVYVVVAGSGEFVNGGTRTRFEAGDILFVPAHMDHRFENFTDDFATWVMFWGPEGGEKP
jgi:mannose-6-phosphate isomerase-like protein (cupin superfamily)